ncbi:MAG: sterol desaturase family protein [Ignavibacteria bacterium]|nr:sterol desaturase family protein [Ignavibacteria bacterium]
MERKITNSPITPRLFKNEILELFSKIPWYVPLIIYIPVVLVTLYYSIYIYQLNIETVVPLFILGIFSWTFVEYILHRFVFHYQPKTPLGEKLHFIFHGVHHSYPKDPLRLVMTPSVSIPLAIIFFLIFYWIFPGRLELPFYAGFVLGYLIYDMTHYAVHHFQIKNKYLMKLKAHHMKHHYQDENLRFGVSTPLWDYVFGTLPTEKTLSERRI